MRRHKASGASIMTTIATVEVTPLRLPLRRPYIWSQGVEQAFAVNLIRITDSEGRQGIGETPAMPDAEAQKRVLDKIGGDLIGQVPFDITQCLMRAEKAYFRAFGANMPRYFATLATGLEMAALDLQGRITGRPVRDLLGGPVRDTVGYFHFLQGDTPDMLAEDAAQAARDGHPILYLKVGLGDAADLAAVRAVRAAAPETRLRLDANEAWDQARAMRMMTVLKPYGIEYLEQPTPAASQAALAHVAARAPIAIGADQSVFTLSEVHTACTTHRADMIAVGPRELGGLRALMKAAAVTEAAGVPLCIHSSMTSGITTCAEHEAGRCIPNLDDGNQIMWQLLRHDLVREPQLGPVRGRLSLPARPRLGVELDEDVVSAAADRHRRFSA